MSYKQPDNRGHFEKFGGKYVPETLIPAITELENLYNEINNQHNKMAQELTNFETFGLYFGILFVTNLIEVSINNIIF